jgi:hypothetical protein
MNFDEFFGPDINRERTTNFGKAMSFRDPGVYRIRILEPLKPLNTHYIRSQKISVVCLGDSCPVCASNMKLMAVDPQNYWKLPTYYPINYRYVCNVLDRTRVRICPECMTSNYYFLLQKTGNKCTNCGMSLVSTELAPLNEIRIASFSETFRNQLKTAALSVMDAEGNIIPVNKYDINVTVTVSSNGKKTITPAPALDGIEDVEVDTSQFIEHTKAALNFSADELVRILEGENFRDVFASRRANKESAFITSDFVLDGNNEIADEVAETLKQFLGND